MKKLNIRKNICVMLGLIVSLILIANFNATQVNASDSNIACILHDVVYDEKNQSYVGEGGITFRVYDVTQRYYTLLSQKSDQTSLQDAMEEVQNTISLDGIEEDVASYVGEAMTGTDGTASFTLPAIGNDGTHDAVYLFVCTDKPKAQESEPQNAVMVLPITDDSGESESIVNIYIKNTEEMPKDTPTPDTPQLLKQQKKEKIPYTGDENNINFYEKLIIISSIMFVLIVVTMSRREKK